VEDVVEEACRRHDRLDCEKLAPPSPVAEGVARLALGAAVSRLIGPEPADILRISALDPACGAGIFLVHGARLLAHAYARRLVGQEPSPELVGAVLPTVILHCIFGIDIDPVAVELTKISLCLETGGVLSISALDRHIICENTLSGPDVEPPAWRDKQERMDVVEALGEFPRKGRSGAKEGRQ
jgi:type I restriction-modification system DNA methylase subunit